MNSNITWIAGIVSAGVVAALLIVWIVLLSGPSSSETPIDTSSSPFGTSDTRTTAEPTGTTAVNEAVPVVSTETTSQKVFKIAEGPIAGATLLETTRPTSTIARFVLATNGHTFDLLLDSPGAVAKAISNTTIPGIVHVVWSEGGRGALLQYVDSDIIKTAHFSLAAPGSTTTQPSRVQFLPQNIWSLSASPDGAQIAYLLKTAAGSDGYTAAANGTGSKKLFSLPFSQALLSWPAQGTLLAQSSPASGVAGVAFSIDAKSGGTSALLYAPGLSATADRAFSKVIYQTSDGDRNTYVHDVKSGLASALSFDPLPEMCVWSAAAGNFMYCAAPLTLVPANYIDLRHLGLLSPSNAILVFDVAKGRSQILALPGSDGGEVADIAEIALSPDDNYLLYIRKGDRSLWGVRLRD